MNAFKLQIELAIELDLPMVVHSRSVGRITLNLLGEQHARKVVMHAFDGRSSAAIEGARRGYFFSIPPSIVRSQQKRKLARSLPLESLLLETDSPVLSPIPGQRNEPCNVLVSAEEISKIKQIPVEKVIDITTNNARSLFSIEKRC